MTQTTKISLKKTNISWIWEIPEDWEVRKLKYVSNTRVSNVDKKSEDENSVLLCNYTDVYKNDNIEESMDFMVATATLQQIKNFKLKEGDIIFTKDSETADDIGVPAYVNLKNNENVVCGYHLAISTPNDGILIGKYLHNLFRSKFLRSYFEVNCNWVTRFWLDIYSIINAPIILPPLSTQLSIAHFLDEKTWKISKLIHNKKELIDLLREQKQSIIHRAVTKGIDPDTKMKDSGIPWIWEIPEEWEVVKLKYLGRIRSGDGIKNTQIKPEWDYEVYWWNGFMWYTDAYNVSDMSIIIGRVGAKCWNVRLINDPKWISDNALIFSLFNPDNYTFLSLLLEIMNLNTLSVSNAQPLITGTVVVNQFIPLPEVNIQNKIFEFLKQETSQIDSAISKIEKEITLIEEYRTSLIYQAVTGKISIS